MLSVHRSTGTIIPVVEVPRSARTYKYDTPSNRRTGVRASSRHVAAIITVAGSTQKTNGLSELYVFASENKSLKAYVRS